MPAEFLKRLPISEDERAQLARFGASTPLSVLNMRRASKEAFDDYFPGRADFIATELEKLLTAEERQSLEEPLKPAGKLGARLGPAGKLGSEK
jgi:hypothetical protein